MNVVIQRLRSEIQSDRAAWSKRRAELRTLRLAPDALGDLAQAAVALHHGYSALESILERVARTLEGSLPVGRDWHVALLESMALEIEGVRPRVLSPQSLAGLRRLLAFRHFFRHAYTVQLDSPKLEELRQDVFLLEAALEIDLDRLDAFLAEVATH